MSANDSNWEKRDLDSGDSQGQRVSPEDWEELRFLTGSAMSVATAVAGDAAAAALKATLEAYLKDHEATVEGYFNGAKAVVLDIEGTTTPIPFVTDVLFPYAEKKVEAFVAGKYEELKGVVAAMRDAAAGDKVELPDVPQIREAGSPAEIAKDVAANLVYNSHKNRKVTPMKELQGRIWKEGYASGELKGFVYPDVPAAFKRWTAGGVKCYIYSSGSIGAQKLLFGQSSAGDLLPYLSGHFDTTTGPKREAASYEKIAAAVGHAGSPGDIVFLTDIVGEANAARAAGMRVALLHRPKNHLFDAADQAAAASFVQLRSFDSILPGQPARKRGGDDTAEAPAAKRAKQH